MSSVQENIDVPSQAAQNEVVDADDDMNNSVQKDINSISFSSSIGLLSNGNGGADEDGEEAESKAVPDEGSLSSLATLEEALPLKRGLSAFYGGKSRTFLNVTEVKSMEEVEKEESPLNKRRRLTVAQTSLYKWGSSGSSSSSMPQLTSADAERTHNVGVEQEFKSSTSNTSLSSDNSATKPFIN